MKASESPKMVVWCAEESHNRITQKVKAYINDFKSCFKTVKAIDEDKVICE